MAPRTTTDPIEILLEMGVDLDNLSDEEDYLSALMEATNALTIKSASDPRIRILQKEILKVRKKRKAADPTFKPRKTKISANSFKKKTSSVKALPGTSKGGALTVRKTKISAEDIKSNEDKNVLESILGSVTNIADMLKEQYKLEEKSAEKDRKSTEKTKRKLQESGLEKAFKGLAKTTQKVIAPVKSLLDKIFGFITTILLAKFLNKFIDWFSDPDNKSKIQSIIRFLGDNWKKLITLYLVFGTGLGRFIVGLTKTLIGGALKLGIAIAKLLAAKKLKGARGAARFLGKRGKLIKGLGTALLAGGAYAGVNSLTSGGEEKQTQGFSGGGLAKPFKPESFPKKDKSNSGMSRGAAIGSIFGPLGTLAGAGIGSLFGAKKSNTVKLSEPSSVTLEVPSSGEVDGPGGIDKVPAMLTDGEFVMSRGAVQKYGVGQLEAMNASGGGTNKPKMMNNMVYAKTGGLISGHKEKQPGGGRFPVISVTHPNTGRGFGLNGLVDYKGRPGVFSKGAAAAFAKMITDSDGQVRGSDIASSQRSKSYNSHVGGVSNSNHLYGNALDIHGSSQTWMRANGSKYGWMINDYPGSHGGHFNYKGAGASKMNKPDEGSPVAQTTGQGGRSLGSTTGRGRPSLAPASMASKNSVPGKASVMRRHAELMKSTDRKRISDYDAKYGEGAYSKKMLDKLNKIYPSESSKAKPTKPTSTAKVVGRENLSPRAQKALARLDAQKAGTLPSDVKTSGPLLGRMVMGGLNMLSGGGLNNMLSGVKNMFGGMGKPPGPAPGMKVVDGNIGTPTAQEQKDIDNLAAKKEKLRKTILRNSKPKPKEDDSALRAEFEAIKNDPNHPMHKKVVGFEATGNLDDFGMRFSDYKKSKSAKIASTPPKVSTPAPPSKPEPKVVVADSGSGGGGSPSKSSGKNKSSDVNAANPGSGSKSKWNILGIPMPF